MECVLIEGFRWRGAVFHRPEGFDAYSKDVKCLLTDYSAQNWIIVICKLLN